MSIFFGDKTEAVLYRMGFRNEQARKLVMNQLLFLVIALLSVPVSGVSMWFISFAAGVLVVSLNFIALARVVPGLVHVQKGAVAPLLFQFYGRLIITGIALAFLIGYLALPVVPLIVGLSTVVANALFWWAQNSFGQNVKEA